jgi:hypothetical protein
VGEVFLLPDQAEAAQPDKLCAMTPFVLLLALSAASSTHIATPTASRPLVATDPHLHKQRVQKTPVPPLRPMLRLRGGDSALQAVSRSYLGVPLLTRSWLSAIVLFAGLSQIGVVAPEALGLDAQATVSRWQIWRPLTAACFLGGLGPQLLQKCYYLVQFGCGLERTLGLGEYARVLSSCTALLCILCNLLGWQFVGDGLIMAITVLTCQQTPDQQVSMYGLNIPTSYLPFAQLCMSYLFTQQIPWQDILGAIVGYVHYHINDNTKPDAAVAHKMAPPPSASGERAGKRLGATKASGGGGGGGGSRKSTPAKKRKPRIATYAAAPSCGPSG